MSATIALKPTIMRATSIFASAVQAVLMGAGVVLVAVMFNIYHGDVRVLDALQSRMLPDSVQSASDVEDMATLAVAESQTVSLSDDLSPRMRGALEFMARRYRVSVDALEPIFAAAETAGHELRVDPLLIVSVIAIESRFNPFSESVVGAQGLMQVMPRWHQDKLPEDADELSFFDPVLNVRIGTRILKDSIRMNGGLVPGLQQYAGASDDPERRYSNKVLAEKARLEAAVLRLGQRNA